MKVTVTQTNETVTQTTRAEIKNQKKWGVIQNLGAGILSKREEKEQLLEEATQAKGAAENLSPWAVTRGKTVEILAML